MCELNGQPFDSPKPPPGSFEALPGATVGDKLEWLRRHRREKLSALLPDSSVECLMLGRLALTKALAGLVAERIEGAARALGEHIARTIMSDVIDAMEGVSEDPETGEGL